MFTGDTVLGQGTAVFEDLATYLSSLEKMKGMFSGRAYPGHGPVIDDGRAKIVEYIQHRQQREQQIIEVLSSPRPSGEPSEDKDLADWHSMDIVKIIYKDVPESLHVPAHGGVMQVLKKLQREDKVTIHPSTQRWRINSQAAL
jgi:glyoxylase-like metal-dependent hydrolase (beta-lactamase superfamily II)